MTLRVSKFLVLFAVLWANIAFSQGLPQDPKLKKGKLKNGMTYYIYPHKEPANQAVIRLFVNAGSMQEEEDQLGLAHFVEHMAFNGSKHYKKNDLITFLESKGVKFGSDLNAHTSFDETVYKLQVPVEDKEVLKESLTIMADWAGGVLFDSLEIEKERGVVMEEWRTGQGASNRMRKVYLPVLLNNSRYAERLPIGKTSVLENFTRDRIVAYYKDWYRPDLMAVAVVGDIDPKEVEKLIKKTFKGIKPVKKPKERIFYPVADHKDTLTTIVTDAEATEVEFSFFKKMPISGPIQTKEDYKKYLTRVFFNRLSSERFQRVAETNTAYRKGSMSVSNIVLTKDALAGGVSLYKEKIRKGITEYVKEQERIFRYGFNAGEIEKIKKNYLLQLTQSVEGEEKASASVFLPDIQANFYNGHAMVSRSQELELAKEFLPQIDSTLLVSYINQLHTPGNVFLLMTAPKKEDIKLPTEQELRKWVAQAAASKDIQPWGHAKPVPDRLLEDAPVAGRIISSKKVKEIEATVWELSNGARVIVKPTTFDHDRIILTGFRQGGIYALDSSKYVTGLFAKSIIGLSGAGEFTRSGLSQYLAGNTASATLILAESREGIAANAKVKDVETMFQLLYLKWTEPQADTTLFTVTKGRLTESLENAAMSTSYDYNRAVTKLLNGESYVTKALTPERVSDELQYEDVLPVFKERFGSANGFTFVLLGNFTLDSIKPYVENYLAALPATKATTNYVYKGPRASSQEKELVMYAGEAPKSQVNLFFQGNEFDYSQKNLLRLQMLEEVLKVKLRNNLREENGGVYGVGVSASATTKPSELYRIRVGFTCAPEKAEFLVEQVESEIKKLVQAPQSIEPELVRIKKQMLEERKKDINKNTFWSSELRNHFYYGLNDWGFFTNYEGLVNSITAKDIAKDANALLVQKPMLKTILMPKSFTNPKQQNNETSNKAK